MTQPPVSSIAEISRSLASGEVSAVELAQDALKKAEKAQQEYNLFIGITADEALEQAKAADKSAGSASSSSSSSPDSSPPPLSGVPYAVKDVFCTKGVRTSCASLILDNFIAPYDATAVANIKHNQGVMIGKTNLDEFAMGSSNEHSYYGAVANPWDVSRVPGGSSGGSAVAVAARVVPYALGTDTGGSVRQPASFCGITGFKPTYGRVSRYGMIAYASSLDQAGIFATSAEDVAQVLQVISGTDDNDSTCADVAVPNYMESIAEASVKGGKDLKGGGIPGGKELQGGGIPGGKELKGMKIGLPQEFIAKELDERIATTLKKALAVLEEAGAEIVPLSLPNISYAIPCYYTIGLAEASANLARYDGVRYGYRTKDAKNLRDLYVNTRSEGFGDEVKKRILLGTYVLTTGYYDAYYLQAQKIRRMIREDFIQAFKQVDMIAGPVTPSVAFKKGEKKDPVSMYLQDIYTVPANLAGLPAMSLPMGFVDDMPVGMQLLGNYFDEGRMLTTAHAYQSMTDWHTMQPRSPSNSPANSPSGSPANSPDSSDNRGRGGGQT